MELPQIPHLSPQPQVAEVGVCVCLKKSGSFGGGVSHELLLASQ